MSDTKTVEVYIGFSHGSWSTDYIEIPAVSDKTINELIDECMSEMHGESEDVAFWGLYNITSEDEDDDD